MVVNVVRGTNSKPVASDALVASFLEQPQLEGELMIGFPILGASSGPFSVDALYLSLQYGLIIFDLIEGPDLGPYQDRQDDAVRLLSSKLLQHKNLAKKNRLRIDIEAISFAPGVPRLGLSGLDSEYAVTDGTDLLQVVQELDQEQIDEDLFLATLSAIQNISSLRRSRSPRIVKSSTSRGAKLQVLESSIATLDNIQNRAVRETIEGVQRIRGLAGSGKTIVLALKAAYLHAQHPDWRIAVTFNTRSLKDQFTRLITGFVIEQTGEEPIWDNLRIVNSWGGRGGPERSGIYFEFCEANKIEYWDFQSAKRAYGADSAFDGVCTAALANTETPKSMYDAILVDEAQDLPPNFLKLCYFSLTEPRRLVYAYDELQSLSGSGLPSPIEIFGLDERGMPRVDFDVEDTTIGARRDIVLEKCYRNSRPVLVTAHALGFGIYRRPASDAGTGLVQMFDQPRLWEDIGYEVVDGNLQAGTQVALRRTEESSPLFLERHSPLEDLIQFHNFKSQEAQDTWVANEISKNINEDELRYEDIIVINPNPRTSRSNLSPLRARLLKMGINNHLAGVDTSQDIFFNHGAQSITFTGIYRAKGNEAGMIYIVNAHEGDSSGPNLALVRNRLFTAITRSKAWVRVIGFGDKMDDLIREFEMTRRENFKLRFKYPTAAEREELRIVHREVSIAEETQINSRRESISGLIDDLERGSLYLQDLDPSDLARLSKLLGNNSDAN
ncbi:DEAD/DEAH box helicase [Paenarthrobacter aurescens]|uniref:UvrD-like helicase C-terminal domain-containing protein n=1 Tax=Paenarthrobacter aurescens TaxID=43663 RepID=A0A4Y3NAM9_PAEAU|nr:ATP-binding domain-containing protein [Paenarthrobacter aurescens]MDO6144905.1 ATP-binding domain-containing protein [Paenarthrobacter aurescens]MDO6148750.1 ATP-binding domain-containing protein [Paenarthrobacter aurescens]MDO6159996.1 ATP-binding domain-containing protein [Paenarthrobacter aurescens]MDO6163855.1 ATP-binding domain-containing protein [Paenarthrobacter aurescens]GEB17435.1 hypothetical protein AAU01_01900 [Paenarthrobacter aurescens]